MSGLVKGVKKAFKSVTKVVKKVVNSKVFKVGAVAALAYFGGAAITSMAGGGTAMGGIQSAWVGMTEAGTALASGNIAGAYGSLSAGFTGGAQVSAIAAGAAPSTIAGMQAGAAVADTTGKTILSAGAKAPSAMTPAVLGSSTPQLDAMKAPAKLGLDTTQQSLVNQTVNKVGEETAKTGLLAGWGDASKAALITGGINMGGQMIQGYAQQKQAEEQAANRDYFGVNGKGEKSSVAMPGLLNPSNIMPNNQVPQLQPLKSLDDLIARKQQQYNATYQKWGV